MRIPVTAMAHPETKSPKQETTALSHWQHITRLALRPAKHWRWCCIVQFRQCRFLRHRRCVLTHALHSICLLTRLCKSTFYHHTLPGIIAHYWMCACSKPIAPPTVAAVPESNPALSLFGAKLPSIRRLASSLSSAVILLSSFFISGLYDSTCGE